MNQGMEVVAHALKCHNRTEETRGGLFRKNPHSVVGTHLYAHLPTPVDSLILALGHAGDRRAVPAVLSLAEKLDARVTLSHHRSVALALERLADPSAAETLAAVLNKPGMRGHAMTKVPRGTKKLEDRTESLREIILARALYRCGDHQGLGRTILQQYQDDFRGLFARHAYRVLKEH